MADPGTLKPYQNPVSRPSSRNPSGQTWLWSAMLLSAVLHAALAAVLWRTERPDSIAPDGRLVAFDLVPAGKVATGEPPRHDSRPQSAATVPSPPAPPNVAAAPVQAPAPPGPAAEPMTSDAWVAKPAPRTSPPGTPRRITPNQAVPSRDQRSHQPPARGATATRSETEASAPENADRPGNLEHTPATRQGESAAAGRRAAERDYLNRLQRAIARHQHYPAGARRHGQTGVVTLAFVIEADGRLGRIRLAQSSGHEALDRSALQALTRLGRFEPIPKSLGRSTWSLRIPIRFDLE